MLVELELVEQRYQAVLEVLNGAAVIDVASSHGVGPVAALRAVVFESRWVESGDRGHRATM